MREVLIGVTRVLLAGEVTRGRVIDEGVNEEATEIMRVKRR